ncbi:hypothetical protein Dimus_028908 [Dionaea muscipula]
MCLAWRESIIPGLGLIHEEGIIPELGHMHGEGIIPELDHMHGEGIIPELGHTHGLGPQGSSVVDIALLGVELDEGIGSPVAGSSMLGLHGSPELGGGGFTIRS